MPLSGPLKKGATAGLPSSAARNTRENTAGQASSGTQTIGNRLFPRAVSVERRPGSPLPVVDKRNGRAIISLMPDLTQFFGLPSLGPDRADVLILPLPIEKTVCYGAGAASGPRAIVEATAQVETFDEETLVEFAESPRIHVLPPLSADGDLEACLARISDLVRSLAASSSEKFLLCLGGEHSVTYGVIGGLVDDPAEVTIVQLDAHGDLADQLGGRYWSHGTVMRRLSERGCRLMQIGIRSMTRDEYDLATSSPRITTYYSHRLGDCPDFRAAKMGLSPSARRRHPAPTVNGQKSSTPSPPGGQGLLDG